MLKEIITEQVETESDNYQIRILTNLSNEIEFVLATLKDII